MHEGVELGLLRLRKGLVLIYRERAALLRPELQGHRNLERVWEERSGAGVLPRRQEVSVPPNNLLIVKATSSAK